MGKKRGLEDAVALLMSIAAIALAFAGMSGCGGDGESTADADSDHPSAAYRAYLLENAEAMNAQNAQLRGKIEAGRIDEAKALFAASQIPFGHLKPALTLSTVGEELLTPPDGAYPRIERLLWSGQTGAAAMKAATEAIEATDLLREQLKTMDLAPQLVAANGRRTIDEIAALDLGLEANPYSHIDVLNASANLEGVKAAFESIRPALAAAEAHLPAEIEKKLEIAFSALEEFGVPAYRSEQPEADSRGTSFASGARLTPQDLHPVHAPVKKLASLFNRSIKKLSIAPTSEAPQER